MRGVTLSCVQFSDDSLVQHHGNVWTEQDIIIFLCTLIRRHPSVQVAAAHTSQNCLIQ